MAVHLKCGQGPQLSAAVLETLYAKLDRDWVIVSELASSDSAGALWALLLAPQGAILLSLLHIEPRPKDRRRKDPADRLISEGLERARKEAQRLSAWPGCVDLHVDAAVLLLGPGSEVRSASDDIARLDEISAMLDRRRALSRTGAEGLRPVGLDQAATLLKSLGLVIDGHSATERAVFAAWKALPVRQDSSRQRSADRSPSDLIEAQFAKISRWFADNHPSTGSLKLIGGGLHIVLWASYFLVNILLFMSFMKAPAVAEDKIECSGPVHDVWSFKIAPDGLSRGVAQVIGAGGEHRTRRAGEPVNVVCEAFYRGKVWLGYRADGGMEFVRNTDLASVSRPGPKIKTPPPPPPVIEKVPPEQGETAAYSAGVTTEKEQELKPESPLKGRAVRVDARSIRLDGRRLVLEGLAMERSAAPEVTEDVDRWLAAHEVTCVQSEKQGEAYTCHADNGKDVSEVFVRKGYSVPYQGPLEKFYDKNKVKRRNSQRNRP